MAHIGVASFIPCPINYRKPTVPPPSGGRQHAFERRADQFADRPNVIGNAELHGGSDPKRFVDTAKVVMRDIHQDASLASGGASFDSGWRLNACGLGAGRCDPKHSFAQPHQQLAVYVVPHLTAKPMARDLESGVVAICKNRVELCAILALPRDGAEHLLPIFRKSPASTHRTARAKSAARGQAWRGGLTWFLGCHRAARLLASPPEYLTPRGTRYGSRAALLLGPQPVEQRAAFGRDLGDDVRAVLLGNLDLAAVVKLLHRLGIGRDVVAVEPLVG